MSASVGIRELRQNASAILKRVQAGESIDITDRGRPVATLGPHQPTNIDRLIAEGRLIPPTSDEDLLTMLKREGYPKPHPGGKTTTEILLEMREDERY